MDLPRGTAMDDNTSGMLLEQIKSGQVFLFTDYLQRLRDEIAAYHRGEFNPDSSPDDHRGA